MLRRGMRYRVKRGVDLQVPAQWRDTLGPLRQGPTYGGGISYAGAFYVHAQAAHATGM